MGRVSRVWVSRIRVSIEAKTVIVIFFKHGTVFIFNLLQVEASCLQCFDAVGLAAGRASGL